MCVLPYQVGWRSTTICRVETTHIRLFLLISRVEPKPSAVSPVILLWLSAVSCTNIYICGETINMSSQIKVYKLIIEDDIYICGCFFLISQQIYTYNRQRLTPEQYNKIPTRSQRPNLRNKKKKTGRRIQTFSRCQKNMQIKTIYPKSNQKNNKMLLKALANYLGL